MMRALIFSLFVLISGGVSAQSLAQAPEWGRCLAAYVSVGERETLIKIRPESKQADGMVKFPIHPSCQGLGIKKEVDPKISKLVVKGKTLSKKVDPSMAKMPK